MLRNTVGWVHGKTGKAKAELGASVKGWSSNAGERWPWPRPRLQEQRWSWGDVFPSCSELGSRRTWGLVRWENEAKDSGFETSHVSWCPGSCLSEGLTLCYSSISILRKITYKSARPMWAASTFHTECVSTWALSAAWSGRCHRNNFNFNKPETWEQPLQIPLGDCIVLVEP